MWLMTTGLGAVLVTSTDLLMHGRLTDPAAVVRYSLTGKLLSILGGQPLALLRAPTPMLAALHARAERDRLAGAGDDRQLLYRASA